MLHKATGMLYIPITMQVVLCKVLPFKESQWPGECNDYFYNKQAPQNIPGNINDYVVIVQIINNTSYYCTLYNTKDKIAVFSAYQMHFGESGECARKDNWYIEPGLSTSTTDGVSNNKVSKNHQEQASNDDYKLAYWDKGHLNPNFFQTGEGREATFRLTNAVPMHPAFNRIYWYELEKQTKELMKKNCSEGKRYLITGAIPSPSKNWKTLKNESKVNIPDYIFTAACCFKQEMSFSFAYIGRNEANTEIFVSNVRNVGNVIQKKWPLEDSKVIENELDFTLFRNDCGNYGDEASKAFKQKLHYRAKMRYENEKILDEMKK